MTEALALPSKNNTIHILIVEDDDDIRLMLPKILEPLGMQCVCVDDGQKAVNSIEEENFDIVITDMQMPILDGMGVIQHVKRFYPSIDVIAITGHSKDYTFSDVISSGAADFIEKPFDKDELIAKISRLMRERKLIRDYRSEINSHLNSKHEIERSYKTVDVINQLLCLSLEDYPLTEILKKFITNLTSLPWLELEPKGAAFLVETTAEGDEKLVMAAHHGLAPPILSKCAAVPFGVCLCGRAAREKQVIFADCVDNRHDISYMGMIQHGHYCIPILTRTSELLGVFTLYTKEKAKHNPKSETILTSAASMIASVIQRKTAEEKLIRINEQLTAEIANRQKEEEKIRIITATAKDAIIMADNEGCISFWNQAGERIFGYSQEEALGKDIHQLLVPEKDLHKARAGFNRFIREGQSAVVGKTVEMMGKRKNGDEFPLELSLSAVQMEDGWQTVGIIRDITRRKFTQAELIKARETAEIASRAKSVFLNIMSHELRTPLNGIVGITSLLRETMANEEQKKYLGFMNDASERLRDLVEEILIFTALEAEKKDLKIEPFNLRKILAASLAKVTPKAQKKGLEVTYSVTDTVPDTLVGDREILQNCVKVILDNAVKFTPKGTIHLAIAPHHISEAGKIFLLFSIRDTGCGIPEDKKDVIFEPFTQAEDYLTRRHEGAGLGLAICSKLVKLMDGEIWHESVVGKGSHFHFTASFSLP